MFSLLASRVGPRPASRAIQDEACRERIAPMKQRITQICSHSVFTGYGKKTWNTVAHISDQKVTWNTVAHISDQKVASDLEERLVEREDTEGTRVRQSSHADRMRNVNVHFCRVCSVYCVQY